MHARMTLAIVAAGLLSFAAAADTIEEKFADGKIKIRYVTDKEGRKNGPYTEFTEKGKKKITAVYKGGKVDGNVTHYEQGTPVWVQAFKNGQPVYSRTIEQIKKKLAEIDPPTKAAFTTVAEERESALRRLKAYRYLANVPYEDMTLDPAMNDRCEAGAKLCERIGRLDHTPANPGMPEIDYRFAYAGTSQSNLGRGDDNLRKAVDGWMDDSDEKNIDHVGHRRWCINPAMLKTGFGRSGQFTAMWSIDKSRKIIPDYNFVAFPPAGYMPAEYFGPKHAWGISFNLRKFLVTKLVTAKIFRVDELLNHTEEIKLNHSIVDGTSVGDGNCVIFRPEVVDMSPGSRYVVAVDGLIVSPGVRLPTQHYFVEFMRLD
jgi:hypothetical protein